VTLTPLPRWHRICYMSNDLHSLLGALVEQARAMAIRMAGDPERATACHFCGGDVPLWESLLVMQLAGVPAHVECPPDVLAAKLKEVGPEDGFPYAEFSAAVDARLSEERPNACSGVIEAAFKADRFPQGTEPAAT